MAVMIHASIKINVLQTRLGLFAMVTVILCNIVHNFMTLEHLPNSHSFTDGSNNRRHILDERNIAQNLEKSAENTMMCGQQESKTWRR